MRDMLAPEGAFYSAEDADSEGVEGTFYVWNPKQIKELLGEKDGQRDGAQRPCKKRCFRFPPAAVRIFDQRLHRHRLEPEKRNE